MIFCARATRGRGLPSLDARSEEQSTYSSGKLGNQKTLARAQPEGVKNRNSPEFTAVNSNNGS